MADSPSPIKPNLINCHSNTACYRNTLFPNLGKHKSAYRALFGQNLVAIKYLTSGFKAVDFSPLLER